MFILLIIVVVGNKGVGCLVFELEMFLDLFFRMFCFCFFVEVVVGFLGWKVV